MKYSEYLQSYYKVKKDKPFDRMRLVMWIGIVMTVILVGYVLAVNVKRVLIRKDCSMAISDYNEYGIQPKEKLVEQCVKRGFQFAP